MRSSSSVEPRLSTSSSVEKLLADNKTTQDNVLVSADFLSAFSTCVDLWLCLGVALVGIITNVVTVIVFVMMGFKDTVSITMTVVAFWDLIRTLCGVLHRCYGVISWVSPGDGLSWQNVTLTNIVYLQLIASNIAYVIGGYVALERCVCVCAPFRVKSLFTPRFALSACVCLSFVVLVTQLPVMLVMEYSWVILPQFQKPVAVYRFTVFYHLYGQSFMDFFRYINLAYSSLSLWIMVVSTVVIYQQLLNSSKFRNGAITKKGQPAMTARDGQVVKMLTLVIATYILVLAPRVVHYMVQLFEPRYYALKLYNNIFWLVVYAISLLDFINATANLFIFYFMSTNFRVTCHKLVSRCSNITSKYAAAAGLKIW